ncbi:hypothetical protein [Corynebacterium sp. MNWGS58]|uniref:hypothetical protein n=1 Tax=Corynebacterium sp. 102791.4 TaxID=3104612 RepID=UPI0035197B40
MNVEIIQEQLGNAVTFFKAFENITKGLEFFYDGENNGFSSTIKDAFNPLSAKISSE